LIFRIFIILLAIICSLAPVFSQRTKSSLSAGEQRHAERSLKNARYFIEFLDSTVSNSGTEEEKKLYLEAVRRDTISRILYMKFAFHESFGETKKSHRLIIKLFKKIIPREIKDSKSLLNNFARESLKSKDKQSKKYLALGYRSVKWSEKTMVMADNIFERNYSIRIYEYIKSLKRAKYARRYAILALIQARLEKHMRLKIDMDSFLKIKKHIEKYLTDKKENVILIHKDNYYMLTEPSEYRKIIKNPGLDEIPEYKEYIRKL